MNHPIPPSKLRRQIAGRSLLLSSLMLFVTACGTPTETFADHAHVQPEKIQMDATTPRTERRLSLRVAPKEGKKAAELVSVSLDVDVNPFWNGLSGEASEVLPWLHVRLVDERDERVIAESTTLADGSFSPTDRLLERLGYGFFTMCEQTDRCEATVRLELERQGPPAGGTVSVSWTGEASATVSGSRADDVEVTLSEL